MSGRGKRPVFGWFELGPRPWSRILLPLANPANREGQNCSRRASIAAGLGVHPLDGLTVVALKIQAEITPKPRLVWVTDNSQDERRPRSDLCADQGGKQCHLVLSTSGDTSQKEAQLSGMERVRDIVVHPEVKTGLTAFGARALRDRNDGDAATASRFLLCPDLRGAD